LNLCFCSGDALLKVHELKSVIASKINLLCVFPFEISFNYQVLWVLDKPNIFVKNVDEGAGRKLASLVVDLASHSGSWFLVDFDPIVYQVGV